MKAYKIVMDFYAIENRSACATNRGRVNYSKREAVEAPFWLAERGYHLTAFEDIETAREWLKSFAPESLRGTWWTLWEVEGNDQVAELPPLCRLDDLGEGRLTPWGKGATWPKGTVMFRSIKLGKEVGL